MINIFSVILNLEDTASSAYAVVADSFSDGEEILENVQEYEILSVDPLVRCRECKYSDTLWGQIFCKHFADEMSVQITEDDYCSRGERKDDE